LRSLGGLRGNGNDGDNDVLAEEASESREADPVILVASKNRSLAAIDVLE
jgi:hypothetical protein